MITKDRSEPLAKLLKETAGTTARLSTLSTCSWLAREAVRCSAHPVGKLVTAALLAAAKPDLTAAGICIGGFSDLELL